MAKIIECVPNFSEGVDGEVGFFSPSLPHRSSKVIEAIAAAVRATQGATLLDVDPGQVGNFKNITGCSYLSYISHISQLL